LHASHVTRSRVAIAHLFVGCRSDPRGRPLHRARELGGIRRRRLHEQPLARAAHELELGARVHDLLARRVALRSDLLYELASIAERLRILVRAHALGIALSARLDELRSVRIRTLALLPELLARFVALGARVVALGTHKRDHLTRRVALLTKDERGALETILRRCAGGKRRTARPTGRTFGGRSL
jgi:hypothetical protein